jgi:hypothetical protein
VSASFRHGATTAVCAAVLLASTAEAQCASGLYPAEGGGCCWPGQTFDASRERCVGDPIACPEGFAPGSGTCIRLHETAPETPAREPDVPLQVIGGISFFGAYVAAATVAFAYQPGGDVLSIHWLLGLVPFANWVHGLLDTGGLALFGAELAITGVQIAGFVLLIVGAVGHPTHRDDAVRLRPDGLEVRF